MAPGDAAKLELQHQTGATGDGAIQHQGNGINLLNVKFDRAEAIRNNPQHDVPAAAAPPDLNVGVPTAGKNVLVPFMLDGDQRYVELRMPSGWKQGEPVDVVYAADGAVMANPEKDCGHQMGQVNGWFKEADTDQFAVACLVPRRVEKFFGGLMPVMGWNTKDAIVGFNTLAQDDALYGPAAEKLVTQLIPVRNQDFTSMSEGSTMASTLENVKGVAFAVGSELDSAPLPKPGVSAVMAFGYNDPVTPNKGGLAIQNGDNLGNLVAWKTYYSHEALPFSQLNRSAPYTLFPNYVAANNLKVDPIISTRYFDETVAGPNAGGVSVVMYMLKAPYDGHSSHGRGTGGSNETSNSIFSTPAPSSVFNWPHVAACKLGLRHNADCAKEGTQ